MPPSIPIALSTSCSSPSPSGGGGGRGRGDAAAATTARRCAAARRGRGRGMDRSEEAVRFPASVVEAAAAAGGGGGRDGEEAAIPRSTKSEATRRTSARSETWTVGHGSHATVFQRSFSPLRLLGSARFGTQFSRNPCRVGGWRRPRPGLSYRVPFWTRLGCAKAE